MKNRILIAFCAILMTFHASSQIAVYKAKQLQAIDSIKLVNDWIKSVAKDSTFSGATDRDIPSAAAVKKHVAWSLLNYVPITRTINGYPLSANITLNKSDVGLGNVDNTSDINKPVSTAQAASIATKQATLVSGSNIKTINSNNLLGSGDISVASLLGFTPENAANKGVANGYADLNYLGKIPASRIDFGQTGQTFVVASQAAMLAVVDANIGALAIRTDENKNYRLIAQPSSTLANWQVLLSPDAPVQSVNGFTGNVNLLTSHISEGSNYYWTAARSRAAQSLTVSGSSGASTYDNITGVLNIPTYTLAGLGGQPQLNGTGFVKASGTTISYDNSTYLTGNQTITLSGDISGSGTTAITTTIGASKVTNAMLAGSIDYAKMNAATVPTWNQNTTGTAAIATRFAGYMGNYNETMTAANTGGILAFDNSVGYFRQLQLGDLKNWLTLGSYAYRSSGLAELTGAIFTGGIKVSNGAIELGTNGYFKGGTYELLFNTSAEANVMHHDASNLYVAGNIYVGGNGYNSGNILATQSYVSGAFLPLSGGTLTGGLSGTTATFSGLIDVTGSVYSRAVEYFRSWASSTGAAQYQSWYNVAGTRRGYFGFGSTNDPTIALVNENANGSIVINANGSGIVYLSSLTTTTAEFGGLATLSSGSIVPNGQYYRANRTTGGASINILGIESGTDNTVMVASNFFKLRNTGTGDAANLFTVSTSGDGVFTGNVASANANISNAITAYSVGLNGSAGGWARHYSFIGSTGTNRGGFGAFGSDNALSYYYIGNAYNDNKLQIDASTGSITASSLAGSGDRMVVANPSGGLSTQAIPTAGTGTNFTPTWSGSFHTGFTNNGQQYSRSGNVVTVSGMIGLTSTTTGSLSFSMSLPVASTFTMAGDCSGSFTDAYGIMQGVVKSSFSTTATFTYDETTATARTFYYHYTYIVK